MKAASVAPEHILIFGSPGSGKSHGAAEIARYHRQRSSTAHFHVLSTEVGTWERIAESYPKSDTDPGMATNVTIHPCNDWLSFVKAIETFRDDLTPGDWVIIDELGSPWQWIRDYWTETRPGYTPPDPLNPFDVAEAEFNADAWTKIKAPYYRALNSLLHSPAHIYACAHEDDLRVEGGWKSADETISVFKYVGMKAVTEKTAPYSFASVLWARRTG